MLVRGGTSRDFGRLGPDEPNVWLGLPSRAETHIEKFQLELNELGLNELISSRAVAEPAAYLVTSRARPSRANHFEIFMYKYTFLGTLVMACLACRAGKPNIFQLELKQARLEQANSGSSHAEPAAYLVTSRARPSRAMARSTPNLDHDLTFQALVECLPN